MDDSEIVRLLQEMRDLQKAQLESLQAWQASLSAQHQEFVDEKKKWLADREKLRQDHLISQARQARARQFVRLYMLGLMIVVALIVAYRLNSG